MWRYRLLLFVLFIPLTCYTLWKSFSGLDLRYFLQRFAIFFPNNINPKGLWIHAASVGEVNAVIPLIIKIAKQHPDLAITLTSNTTTSAPIVKKQLKNIVQHIYFPLDYSWAIKRILNKILPKTIFIVETEFWPNLYTVANKRNIPLIIINGRISNKTLHAKKWITDIYAEILPQVTLVLARSDKDEERFISLGLPKNKVKTLGNIKFSILTSEKIKPIKLTKKYILAASTRDNEEQLIVDAWIKAKTDNHVLVIVPRHPHRLSGILKNLTRFHLNIAVRSKNENVNKQTDIYIADTIGELKQFIAGSEFVVMGGSFVRKGGHNIVEVAQLGKAVIFGTDMSNFEDEANIFIQYNAGIQCEIAELTNHFDKFIGNTVYRKTLENNSLRLIDENNNIEKYYNHLVDSIIK